MDVWGSFSYTTHHAEGLVNPKVREQNKRLLILDTPEHVLYSENIKYKIGSRGGLLYQHF
jgi:hypothetical protein